MGEYVSLGKVEASLKVHPLVDTVCVIADSSKTYCVALVVPDMAKITELAMKLELCLGFEELCGNEIILETVSGMLISHAQDELQKFEIPRKYALIAKTWTPDTGLVTAALKLRRKIIHKEYKEVIELLYNISTSQNDLDSPGPKIKLA